MVIVVFVRSVSWASVARAMLTSVCLIFVTFAVFRIACSALTIFIASVVSVISVGSRVRRGE